MARAVATLLMFDGVAEEAMNFTSPYSGVLRSNLLCVA
jgi:predicted 3-demethylubiquinone-9 3-methyltransferase (glyoxalase superfamily)